MTESVRQCVSSHLTVRSCSRLTSISGTPPPVLLSCPYRQTQSSPQLRGVRGGGEGGGGREDVLSVYLVMRHQLSERRGEDQQ